ncbi:UDP-N-acetylmuramoyl-L-alanine--D-glutamate ligase [Halosquirtibacter xylanolyticus]|uniref:UDP-N-acetylmuramoyl-L-alanine--D-glutamate ligase n=1 Tax=Halosquirtibacter xylanolyticus TaxID=3374599 RepID=UPI00374A62AA|nr:UDP-N-acetylmuramoyl-L-alanine--D-glutamate ligase [Prolixibacteraceae bacterium]
MERIVILGAGESGVGSAILAHKRGYNVMVSDFGTMAPKYREELDSHGIAWEEGGHSDDLLNGASLVVKSPGIPRTAPIVKKIDVAGIPIASEIEFAGQFYSGKSICITGSNGKTTTTSLLYHMLKEAGYTVGVGGNIGTSFARQIADQEFDWFVLELSSFQLEDMHQFKADISILLNITPDHLDRYDYQLSKYADAKLRIIQNQKEEDLFIFFEDDETIAQKLTEMRLPMASASFSLNSHSPSALAKVNEGHLDVSLAGRHFVAPLASLPLKGRHNWCNMMAAVLTTLRVGMSHRDILKGLETFEAVAHRLELSRILDGVSYINDSKATNIDATRFALDAYEQDIVWIVGGTDKGNDYSIIESLVKEKVKAIICLGMDNSKIVAAFQQSGIPIVETDAMEKAVAAAHGYAKENDIVLLSPCCASFDLFQSYIDRGNQFKEYVNAL